jgi:hypothetical protein
MPKMRGAQIARPNGAFEIVQSETPQPAPGWVRIKVQACGICQSDSLVKIERRVPWVFVTITQLGAELNIGNPRALWQCAECATQDSPVGRRPGTSRLRARPRRERMHRKFRHPKVPGSLILSGHDGDDALHY